MGKVSKDDKIKLLEAKVSLLEAEVLLKDELLDFMQAGMDKLTENVNLLDVKAKSLEDWTKVITEMLLAENNAYSKLMAESEECVRSRDELVVKVGKLESELKAIPAWIRKLFK